MNFETERFEWIMYIIINWDIWDMYTKKSEYLEAIIEIYFNQHTSDVTILIIVLKKFPLFNQDINEGLM